MNRAVKFEEDRRRLGARAHQLRSGRGLAVALVAAALSLASCERSKVVVEIYWDDSAVVTAPDQTKISVAFKDPKTPLADGSLRETTTDHSLPPKPPLTLVYFVDDANRKIDVKVELKVGDNSIFTQEASWDGKPIVLCVDKCGASCPLKCSTTHPDGGAGSGPDASGGRGGEAAGGQPGSGGAGGRAGVGGAMAVGGATMMTATGGAGTAGMGGRPVSEGGRGGKGGVGGVSIIPVGGSKGQGGVIGVGGSAIGGTPGVGVGGVGGSATGGSATGGSATGGMVGTGGMMGMGGATPTGGAGGSAPPTCLTDKSLPCTCDDYCEALSSKECLPFGYFLPVASPSRKDCLDSCTAFGWQPGLNDPIPVPDTIGCRVAQAQRGACSSASPTGGNWCGGHRCVAYCDALDQNCPGSLSPYAGSADCVNKCMHPGFYWDLTENLATSGATGDCLLYMAGKAATATDKMMACKNAGPQSSVCQ